MSTAMNSEYLKKALFLTEFHTSMRIVENRLFTMAGEYAKNYSGGLWTVFEKNGFVFVVPPENDYEVSCSDNYYSGNMDAKTFGAALMLKMMNDLCWGLTEPTSKEKMIESFYKLRNFVYDNPSEFLTVEIQAFLD